MVPLHNSELAAALQNELEVMECPGALVGICVGTNAPQVFAVLGVADVKTEAPVRHKFTCGSAASPSFSSARLCCSWPRRANCHWTTQSRAMHRRPAGRQDHTSPTGQPYQRPVQFNPEPGFSGRALLADPERAWTSTEILSYAFAKPGYHAPGEKWRYSNTNTVLLGDVIEKVTGTTCTSGCARVLVPLGVEHTAFTPTAGVPQPSPSGYRNGRENSWVGYGKKFYDVTGYSASWAGSAGNVYSTVDDLLKATKPLAAGTLLNEKARKDLHAWVATTEPGLRYGFCLADYRGWQGHFGDVPGFSAFIGYLPERDTTLVVLANLSNNKDGSVPANQLRNVVIKQLER